MKTAFIPQSLITRQPPREPKLPLALFLIVVAGVRIHHPRAPLAIRLPFSVRHGHGPRREHGLYVLHDGLQPRPQTAVGVVLVELVVGTLAQRGEQLLQVEGGRVRQGLQGAGSKVDEGEEGLGREELEHLAELEEVACGARIVAEFALAVAGGVECEEVALNGGDGVEDALAAVLELGCDV